MPKIKDNKKGLAAHKIFKEAVKSALSDGVVSQDEEHILDGLARSLDISEEDRIRIIAKVIANCSSDPKSTNLVENKEAKALYIEKTALEKSIKTLKAEEKKMLGKLDLLKNEIHSLKTNITQLNNINSELEIMLEADKDRIKFYKEEMELLRHEFSRITSNGSIGKSITKNVFCSSCNTEISVELVDNCPTVFQCPACNQKGYVEPDFISRSIPNGIGTLR